MDLGERLFTESDQLWIGFLIEEPEQCVCDSKIMNYGSSMKQRGSFKRHSDTTSVDIAAVLTIGEDQLGVEEWGQRKHEALVGPLCA